MKRALGGGECAQVALQRAKRGAAEWAVGDVVLRSEHAGDDGSVDLERRHAVVHHLDGVGNNLQDSLAHHQHGRAVWFRRSCVVTSDEFRRATGGHRALGGEVSVG